MPRGRYGSRIGLIRRTEINLGSFDSLFLFNLFLAVDWIIYSLHSSFFNSFPPPYAVVFPEHNGLQRQSSVPSRCRCRYHINTLHVYDDINI